MTDVFELIWKTPAAIGFIGQNKPHQTLLFPAQYEVHDRKACENTNTCRQIS